MKIASLVNSGESLDKAIVLAYLTMRDNKGFYDQFEAAQIYYDENLPKKEHELQAHGAIGSSLEHLHEILGIPHRNIGDLWDDKAAVANKLVAANRITPRIRERLLIDEARFRRTIDNFPWYVLFPEYGDRLINHCNQRYPKLQFIKLNMREDFEGLQASIRHYPAAKLYTINPDGKISSTKFGWERAGDPSKAKRCMDRSIAYSGNVYLFMMQIRLRAMAEQGIFMGYREMKRFPRPSYNYALKALFESNLEMVVEPSNRGFGEVLRPLSLSIPMEQRTNLAVKNGLRLVLG